MDHIPQVEGMNDEMLHFEEYLRKGMEDIGPEAIREPIRDLIRAGGKRIRPWLLIASCYGGSYRRDEVFPAAAAVEVLHTASLIHDDIVDEASMRRGTSSTHSKYGLNTALYTGDYLFCTSLSLLNAGGYAGELKNRILTMIVNCMKRICEGEVEQYARRFDLDTSPLCYLRLIRKKTASLFQTSCRLGAHLGGLEGRPAERLARYGYYTGMMFQITDDLLDLTGREMITGKPVQNDYAQGVYTLPVILALRDTEYGCRLRQELKRNEPSSKRVNALVVQSKAIEATQRVIDGYIRKAEQLLDLFRPGLEYEALKEMVDRVRNRVA